MALWLVVLQFLAALLTLIVIDSRVMQVTAEPVKYDRGRCFAPALDASSDTLAGTCSALMQRPFVMVAPEIMDTCGVDGSAAKAALDNLLFLQSIFQGGVWENGYGPYWQVRATLVKHSV